MKSQKYGMHDDHMKRHASTDRENFTRSPHLDEELPAINS